MLSNIRNPNTKNNIISILLYGFVSVLILLPYVKVFNNTEVFVLDKLTILFCVLLVALLITSYWLFFITSLFVLMTSTIALHIIKTWGVWGLGARISVALSSPPQEMREYLYSYMDIKDVFIILYVSLCVYVIFKIKKRKTNIRLLKYFSWFYIASLPLILSLNSGRLIADSYPLSALPLEVVNTYNTLGQIKKRGAYIDNNSGSLVCSENYQNLVIVIGESVNKNNMGIYAHNKNTTPFLDSLDGIILNVISPADTTRYSLPLILTKAQPEKFNDFYSSQSIVKDLENCGYDTTWISNQVDRGKWDNNIVSIAKEARHTVFLKNQNFETDYDENIIPELKIALNHVGKKKAVFIHLAGSHFNYAMKYPKSFEGFGNKSIVNSYDTSILYTDSILQQIFEQDLKRDSLLFIYMADHGEVVTEKKYGHGLSPGYRDEYDIPLFIWSSNKDRAKKILSLNKQTHLPINGSMIYHMIRYLIGLKSNIILNRSDSVIEVAPHRLVNYGSLQYYPD